MRRVGLAEFNIAFNKAQQHHPSIRIQKFNEEGWTIQKFNEEGWTR
jgi:hypothetical protein